MQRLKRLKKAQKDNPSITCGNPSDGGGLWTYASRNQQPGQRHMQPIVLPEQFDGGGDKGPARLLGIGFGSLSPPLHKQFPGPSLLSIPLSFIPLRSEPQSPFFSLIPSPSSLNLFSPFPSYISHPNWFPSSTPSWSCFLFLSFPCLSCLSFLMPVPSPRCCERHL